MEGNRLIAEFMEVETEIFNTGILNYYHQDLFEGSWFEEGELSYNLSWDWLIPVVQKIEQYCEGVPQEMLNISLYSDINEVHNAVVEFINEHNKTI